MLLKRFGMKFCFHGILTANKITGYFRKAITTPSIDQSQINISFKLYKDV